MFLIHRDRAELFVFHVCVNGFYEESLFSFAQFAEIQIKVLQRLVIRIDVVVFVIGFSEQKIGGRAENIGDLDDLFECGAGTPDLPAADRGLLDAEFIGEFALGGSVLFS